MQTFEPWLDEAFDQHRRDLQCQQSVAAGLLCGTLPSLRLVSHDRSHGQNQKLHLDLLARTSPGHFGSGIHWPKRLCCWCATMRAIASRGLWVIWASIRLPRLAPPGYRHRRWTVDRELAEELGVTAVLQNYSRLVVDCNRELMDPGAVSNTETAS